MPHPPSASADLDPAAPRAQPWRRLWIAAMAAVLVLALAEVGLRLVAPHERHFYLDDFPFLLGERVFRYRQLAGEGMHFDTLLLGDSTAELGLVPTEFRDTLGDGPNAFSLTGPMLPRLLKAVCESELATSGQHPRTLVISMAFYTFNDGSQVLADFWDEYFSYAGIRAWEGTLSLPDHLALWRHRHVARLMLRRGGPYFHAAEWVMENDGWLRMTRTFASMTSEEHGRIVGTLNSQMENFQIGPETRGQMRAAFQAAARQSDRACFVLGAVHPDFETIFPGSAAYLQLVADTILPLARECGLQALDCRHLPFLERDHFVDCVHLNETGARLFSRWVGEQIAAASAGQ